MNNQTAREIWGKALAAFAACVITVQILGCSIFPEATFQLSSDSRLPRWLSLPAGVDRSQITVQMDYYTSPWSRKATFTIIGPDKRVLATVTGSLRGRQPLNSQGEPSTAYPSYELVEANGLVDVVEHRNMEPRFWMTDDASVWKAIALRK